MIYTGEELAVLHDQKIHRMDYVALALDTKSSCLIDECCEEMLETVPWHLQDGSVCKDKDHERIAKISGTDGASIREESHKT